MKVRNGFVSNSSSSSFVIFASKEVFNKTLKDCSSIEQKIAKLFIGPSEKFLGGEVMSYSYLSGNNGDWHCEQVSECISDCDDYPDEDDNFQDKAYEFAFGGFETKLEKTASEMGETVLTHNADC